MSVAMDGTSVLFAEVPPEAWCSERTVPFVRARKYQRNITSSLGQRGSDLSRWGTAVLAVPPPAVSARPRNRTTATESGESFAYGITHPHAAVPVTLHRLDLLRSQQRIRDELVLVEDREVVSRGHVCFGRVHSLMGGSVDL